MERDVGLAVPVRFMLDEMQTVGRLTNLQRDIIAGRRYNMAFTVVFQTYTQATNTYDPSDDGHIIDACDSVVLMGRCDYNTTSILQRMTYGELTDLQLTHIPQSDCIVIILGVPPVQDKKLCLANHPNYKYTAEANPANSFTI
jgi:type IV secretion system protein VirD4